MYYMGYKRGNNIITINIYLIGFNTFKNTLQASTGVLPDGWQITSRGSWIQSEGFVDRSWSRLGSFYLDVSKYGDRYTSHIIASHGRERTYQSWFGLSEEDYRAGDRHKYIAGTDYGSKAGEPFSNQIDNYHQTHLQWIQNFLWKNDKIFYFKKHKFYNSKFKKSIKKFIPNFLFKYLRKLK